jgi:hypothetical protein
MRVGDEPGKALAGDSWIYLLIARNLRRFAARKCHGNAGEQSS